MYAWALIDTTRDWDSSSEISSCSEAALAYFSPWIASCRSALKEWSTLKWMLQQNKITYDGTKKIIQHSLHENTEDQAVSSTL